MLDALSEWFSWGYVPANTNRKDPLLSPIFAERAHLPPKVCLIGCELDILCKESEDMAENLADGETGEKVQLRRGTGWERGGVKWEKVMWWEHGLDYSKVRGDRD